MKQKVNALKREKHMRLTQESKRIKDTGGKTTRAKCMRIRSVNTRIRNMGKHIGSKRTGHTGKGTCWNWTNLFLW